MEVKKIAHLKGHSASIYDLTKLSEKSVLSSDGNGWLVEWNLQNPDDSGKLIVKAPGHIYALHITENKEWIISGDMDGGLHWIHQKNVLLNKDIAHHKKGVFGITEYQDKIYTIGGDGCLTKWTNLGFSEETIQLSNKALRAVQIVNTKAYISSSDHAIYVVDLINFQLERTKENAHENSIFSLCVLSDGILSGSRDAMLKKWSFDLSLEIEIIAHLQTINDIKLSPGGKYFATAGKDKTVKIWETKTMKLLKVLEGFRDNGHFNSVNRLLWLEYKNYLLSCGDDRTIIIWQVQN